MKKIFLDTNILLDVLLDRQPFSEAAQIIWSLAERKKVRAAVSAISLNNIFFIVKRLSTGAKGYQALTTITDLFSVIEVGPRLVRKALQARWPDFEDAVQYYSAVKFGAKIIISRDPSGFVESRIAIMDCAQYLADQGGLSPTA